AVPAVAYCQRLAVVAPAAAHVAGHVDIRQEMHLDAQHPIALTGLAAPAADIEAEAPRVVAARAGFGDLRKQLADHREQSGVGGRVGARRAADRILVDVNDALEALEPANLPA